MSDPDDAGPTPWMGGEVTRLRKARWQAGLSQRRLAELAGVDARSVQSIEAGHCPHLRSLVRLARALGRPVDDLIEPDWIEP